MTLPIRTLTVRAFVQREGLPIVIPDAPPRAEILLVWFLSKIKENSKIDRL